MTEIAAKVKGKSIGWYLSAPVMAYRVIRHRMLRMAFYYTAVRDYWNGGSLPYINRMWNTDPRFNTLFDEVADHCTMEKDGLYNIWQFARQASSVPGDIAEVGVYRAGTARMMARIFPKEKCLHLFDTFEGMPTVHREHDRHHAGDFSDAPLAMVKDYLKDFDNIRLHQGFFPDTAGPVMDKRFCFAHIDGDIYQTTKDSCAFFYGRMSPGGIMVFHDYEIQSCPGVKIALDEFFADKPERVLYLPTNQAFVVKL
jgi:hypothetical protein